MDPHDIIQHRPIENRSPLRRMEGLPRIEFRSSTFAWLFQSGTGWMILALAVAVVAGGSYAGYWWQTSAVLAVVLGVYIAWTHIENRTSLFWIDDQRLFMRRGILMRSEEEIELYRIKDVKVSFSLIEQMFNAGTIQISSSDASSAMKAMPPMGRSTIIITNVRDARAIRAEIRDRVEAIRQKRGVREFDIG
ncbi:PH domain-containing protein [Blastomonas sp.]|uniref:PH domain-containing protein n=1 Tax=Blastomonas sp. TaxID=1909299 RepID=UPI00391A5AB8